MNKIRSSFQWIDLVPRGDFLRGVAASLLVLALAGCGGGGGDSGGGNGISGAPGAPPVSNIDAAALAAATALNVKITAVTINGPPVVEFTVTNQDGTGMAGLTDTDLRFNIAKLSPGQAGGPTTWQNYINTVVNGAVQGSQERKGSVFGTLANRGNGSYIYTFATDITSGNACPAPCTDANGKVLDISYQPGATHRVAIQQANGAYPHSTGVIDFVPNGGAGAKRDIVANATCNQCHSELTAHGTRIDVRMCVTCHNPGSWVAGTPAGAANVSVDFKVMIHKIHYNNAGAALPSVIAGTPYIVNGTDFSKVLFPQDARNCTKCHDGTAGAANATAQGDNWKFQPSMDACGSCHDNVYFGTKPDPAKPYQTLAHLGGVMTDNSVCASCHAAGRFPDNKDIVIAHNLPGSLAAAAAKFKYNIISVTPATAGTRPVVTFSVTDPTNANAPYDIKTAPAFTAAASSLNVELAWTTALIADIGNEGLAFGQPVSINALATAVAGTVAGTYTVTSPVPIPAGQTGTLRAVMDGHPAGDVRFAGSFTDKLPVTSVFRDFAISGTAVARRVVVDIAKCNVCHGTLSLHDDNRNYNGEPGVCAVCHNPNATDRAQRIAAGAAGEESIDFKTMIHAIHAGQADKGGFRTKGITIYGAGPKANDFSSVVFPGKLNNCTACHTGTSYLIAGIWATPTASKILSTTVSTGADTVGSADNLRNSPTASVCSSCHDSAVAKTHMQDAFNGGIFSATQAVISAAAEENCSFCHGSGKAIDVKLVHGVQ